MEFPDLGAHCSHPTCNKLDFLPVKCDGCRQMFCCEHMKYVDHKCPSDKWKDVQVPVCPLCNKPVPSKRTEPPDVAVSAHIDRDCQSDPAVKIRSKVYKNKCEMKGCRKKELVPFICRNCHANFCITHRHSSDHACRPSPKPRNQSTNGPTVPPTNGYQAIQGNMEEDEALARAIALSLQESDNVSHQQLQNTPSNSTSHNQRNSNSSCKIS